MQNVYKYIKVPVFVVAVIFTCQILSFFSDSIARERISGGYGRPLPQGCLKESPLDRFMNTAMITGFAGVAADLLWLKCDHYWHYGQWHKLIPMYYLITRLQPRFTKVWVIGGWHMAYNISHLIANDEEIAPTERKARSLRWIDRGIAFLKDGLRYNSNKYDIYFELGWIYYYKLNDPKEALKYLQKSVMYEHPLFVEKLLAHAYEKCGMYSQSYNEWNRILVESGGKDGVAKRQVEKLYGVLNE